MGVRIVRLVEDCAVTQGECLEPLRTVAPGQLSREPQQGAMVCAIAIEHRAETRLRAGAVTGALGNQAEVERCLDKSRISAQCGVEVPRRKRRLALRQQQRARIVVRLGEIIATQDGLAVGIDRLVGPSHFLEQHAVVVRDSRVRLQQVTRTAVTGVGLGLVAAARFEICNTEPRMAVLGRHLHHLAQGRQGLGNGPELGGNTGEAHQHLHVIGIAPQVVLHELDGLRNLPGPEHLFDIGNHRFPL